MASEAARARSLVPAGHAESVDVGAHVTSAFPSPFVTAVGAAVFECIVAFVRGRVAR